MFALLWHADRWGNSGKRDQRREHHYRKCRKHSFCIARGFHLRCLLYPAWKLERAKRSAVDRRWQRWLRKTNGNESQSHSSVGAPRPVLDGWDELPDLSQDARPNEKRISFSRNVKLSNCGKGQSPLSWPNVPMQESWLPYQYRVIAHKEMPVCWTSTSKMFQQPHADKVKTTLL